MAAVIARAAIEGVVGGFFKNYTTDDLQWAIDNNVDLVALAINHEADTPGGMRGLNVGKKIAKHYPNGAKSFTTDFILNYMKDKYGRFHEVMSTPEGQKWLSKNVESLRSFFWGQG